MMQSWRVRAIRVGLYLPAWTGGLSAGLPPRPGDLIARAQDIEAAGFDALWVADQLVQRFDDGPPIAFFEAWTLLGAIASATNSITLGPLVSSVGFRNPALLAHMAATLSALSDGRLTLGIGAGYDPGEHRERGFPWAQRAERLEEAAGVLRTLLDGGTSTNNGAHVVTNRCTVDLVFPPVPIIIGTLAGGPRMMRCAAQYADIWCGWRGFDDNTPTAVRPHLSALARACEEVGRDPTSIRRMVGVSVHPGGPSFRFGEIDLTPIAVHPEPREVADTIADFGAEGIDEVALYSFPFDTHCLGMLADALTLLDAD